VVIKHNVQIPIGVGVRIAVAVRGVSSRADQVATADDGGQLARMAAGGEEAVRSTGK
jgi:predicted thioesterase